MVEKLLLLQLNEPIQARLDYIKCRFIEKLLSGEFTGPKAREVTMGREDGGEKERKGAHQYRTERREKAGRPKCLNYVGKSLRGKGSQCWGLGMPDRD